MTTSMPDTGSPTFDFVANHPAIDFVNTQVCRQDELVELLPTLGHLVAWLDQAGLLTEGKARAALAPWDAVEAARVLTEARTLRDLLRGMIERIVGECRIEAEPIEAINQLLQVHSGHLKVEWEGQRFRKRFVHTPEVPMHLLVPIAEAAADLLAEADFSLIKRCDNPECIRYFYDTTRNHARRWCSMERCGNRIKAAVYYRRHRPSSG